MADVIDYDEFLTGERNEAQYLMFLDFIPKFVSVPSQCIPFLAMAYAGYNPGLPTDDIDNRQPAGVVWTLKLCFSVIPAMFTLSSLYFLLQFPMQDENCLHEIHEAVQLHKRGKVATDPIYGVKVEPLQSLNCDRSTRHLLNHFTSTEIAVAVEKKDLSVLKWNPIYAITISLLTIPLSVWVIVIGWAGMSTKTGASLSPIGMITLGIALVIIWFSIVRLLAAGKLEESSLDILGVAKELSERSMKLSVPAAHSSTTLHIDSSEGSLVFTKSKSWCVHVEARVRT